MNRDRIEGNWKHWGSAREKWGELTDAETGQIAGRRDKLVGRVQEAYGILRKGRVSSADRSASSAAPAAMLAALLLVAVACSLSIPPPNSAAERQVIEQGAEYDKVIVAQFGVYDDDRLAAYVDGAGQRIAARSEWTTLPWHFRVLDSSAVNAFAVPGGYIYLTRGLLAHMNSEAELAGVLGHEIAHVTSRHGAEAQRRATFANLGLLIGSVVSPEFASYGMQSGLAQAAVGITLLKYSRSQELESDEKGIGYAVAAGYDPSGIGAFFATLQALEEEGDGRGVPGWASTHPQVEDRIERSRGWAAAAIATHGVHPDELIVNHRGHVERLDGIVFGDDPRQGFFRDYTFLHPDLRFRLELPDGWDAVNTRYAVQALAPNEDALVQLTLARPEGGSNEAHIRDWLRSISARVIEQSDRDIHGYWARRVHFTVAGQSTNYEVLGAWIDYRGNLYQLLGVSTPARYDRYDNQFASSFSSFDELRDRSALDVRPSRLQIVTPRDAMTLSALIDRHPEMSAKPSTIALINATNLDTRLSPDTLVKLIEGDALLLATTSTRARRQ